MHHLSLKISPFKKLLLIFFFALSNVHMAFSQLREFEVLQMAQPNVAVVQANTQFPDDALVLVYAALEGLDFRSSLGALDKVTYNANSSRYEILLKPVKQMLFVAKPGYIEEKITTLNPNPKDVFYFRVEEKVNDALVGKGRVKIDSEPQGCTIFINGLQLANKTPFSQEVPAGNNRILLQRERYLDLDTLVKIVPEVENVFKLKMKPSWADLYVKSNYTDAQILINGQQKGLGMVEYRGVDFGLKPGSYTVDVTKSSYRPFKQILELRAGQIEQLNVQLEPMGGMVGVASEPPDADVLVNGRKLGVTPFKTQLAIGEYSLDVVKQGYTKASYKFTLNDNENLEYKPVLVNYSLAMAPVKKKIKKFGLYSAIGAACAAGFYFGGQYAYAEYPKATNQAANLRRFVIASDALAPAMAGLALAALYPTIKFTLKGMRIKREIKRNI